jgi:thiol-disulfide isomerase/thioredoxin
LHNYVGLAPPSNTVGKRSGSSDQNGRRSGLTHLLVRRATSALLLAPILSSCSPVWVPRSEPHDLVSRALPERREMTMSSQLVSIPRGGSVTLIDVWSTSCKPCLQAMPEIEALWGSHKADGLLVVGIAVDDNPGVVTNKVRELGITYPIVMDPTGAIRGSLRVTDLPGALVIDRAGLVRAYRQGADADDRRELREAVEALLAEDTR